MMDLPGEWVWQQGQLALRMLSGSSPAGRVRAAPPAPGSGEGPGAGAAEPRALVGPVAPVEDAGLAHRTRLVAVPVTSP